MFGGTWAFDSRSAVKGMCQGIVVATPVPMSTSHLKWNNTPITFDAFDYSENMTGVG
jgi:hypothetical protein